MAPPSIFDKNKIKAQRAGMAEDGQQPIYKDSANQAHSLYYIADRYGMCSRIATLDKDINAQATHQDLIDGRRGGVRLLEDVVAITENYAPDPDDARTITVRTVWPKFSNGYNNRGTLNVIDKPEDLENGRRLGEWGNYAGEKLTWQEAQDLANILDSAAFRIGNQRTVTASMAAYEKQRHEAFIQQLNARIYRIEQKIAVVTPSPVPPSTTFSAVMEGFSQDWQNLKGRASHWWNGVTGSYSPVMALPSAPLPEPGVPPTVPTTIDEYQQLQTELNNLYALRHVSQAFVRAVDATAAPTPPGDDTLSPAARQVLNRTPAEEKALQDKMAEKARLEIAYRQKYSADVSSAENIDNQLQTLRNGIDRQTLDNVSKDDPKKLSTQLATALLHNVDAGENKMVRRHIETQLNTAIATATAANVAGQIQTLIDNKQDLLTSAQNQLNAAMAQVDGAQENDEKLQSDASQHYFQYIIAQRAVAAAEVENKDPRADVVNRMCEAAWKKASADISAIQRHDVDKGALQAFFKTNIELIAKHASTAAETDAWLKAFAKVAERRLGADQKRAVENKKLAISECAMIAAQAVYDAQGGVAGTNNAENRAEICQAAIKAAQKAARELGDIKLADEIVYKIGAINASTTRNNPVNEIRGLIPNNRVAQIDAAEKAVVENYVAIFAHYVAQSTVRKQNVAEKQRAGALAVGRLIQDTTQKVASLVSSAPDTHVDYINNKFFTPLFPEPDNVENTANPANIHAVALRAGEFVTSSTDALNDAILALPSDLKTNNNISEQEKEFLGIYNDVARTVADPPADTYIKRLTTAMANRFTKDLAGQNNTVRIVQENMKFIQTHATTPDQARKWIQRSLRARAEQLVFNRLRKSNDAYSAKITIAKEAAERSYIAYSVDQVVQSENQRSNVANARQVGDAAKQAADEVAKSFGDDKYAKAVDDKHAELFDPTKTTPQATAVAAALKNVVSVDESGVRDATADVDKLNADAKAEVIPYHTKAQDAKIAVCQKNVVDLNLQMQALKAGKKAAETATDRTAAGVQAAAKKAADGVLNAVENRAQKELADLHERNSETIAARVNNANAPEREGFYTLQRDFDKQQQKEQLRQARLQDAIGKKLLLADTAKITAANSAKWPMGLMTDKTADRKPQPFKYDKDLDDPTPPEQILKPPVMCEWKSQTVSSRSKHQILNMQGIMFDPKTNQMRDAKSVQDVFTGVVEYLNKQNLKVDGKPLKFEGVKGKFELKVTMGGLSNLGTNTDAVTKLMADNVKEFMIQQGYQVVESVQRTDVNKGQVVTLAEQRPGADVAEVSRGDAAQASTLIKPNKPI